MDAKILELTRDDPRYPYEAYEFVCDAVTHTQDRLSRGRSAPDADRHVSGEELLRGACALAVREFGMMAPAVFRAWNVLSTDDIGALVFRLIEAEKLSRSDDDDPADFHDVFDLFRELDDGFELTLAAYPAAPVRKGER